MAHQDKTTAHVEADRATRRLMSDVRAGVDIEPERLRAWADQYFEAYSIRDCPGRNTE
jgi:hypothetical protein